MKTQQDNGSGPLGDMKLAGRWFLIAIDGPAMTIRMLLHHRFGSHQPGFTGVMGLLTLILFASQCSPAEIGPVDAFTQENQRSSLVSTGSGKEGLIGDCRW